jgi:hypothetical protein
MINPTGGDARWPARQEGHAHPSLVGGSLSFPEGPRRTGVVAVSQPGAIV